MSDTKPWNPSKSTRVLIGIATLWPPVYLVLFMASIGFSFFWFGSQPAKQSHLNVDFFKYIFPLHCLTMLLSFGLTAVYIVHAFRNDALRQETRILWVIILFMGNMLAFPVYWWIYLRPGAKHAASSPVPPAG
jgi:hypothetical protein